MTSGNEHECENWEIREVGKSGISPTKLREGVEILGQISLSLCTHPFPQSEHPQPAGGGVWRGGEPAADTQTPGGEHPVLRLHHQHGRVLDHQHQVPRLPHRPQWTRGRERVHGKKKGFISGVSQFLLSFVYYNNVKSVSFFIGKIFLTKHKSSFIPLSSVDCYVKLSPSQIFVTQ